MLVLVIIIDFMLLIWFILGVINRASLLVTSLYPLLKGSFLTIMFAIRRQDSCLLIAAMANTFHQSKYRSLRERNISDGSH
jgi:hypothetical protein